MIIKLSPWDSNFRASSCVGWCEDWCAKLLRTVIPALPIPEEPPEIQIRFLFAVQGLSAVPAGLWNLTRKHKGIKKQAPRCLLPVEPVTSDQLAP